MTDETFLPVYYDNLPKRKTKYLRQLKQNTMKIPVAVPLSLETAIEGLVWEILRQLQTPLRPLTTIILDGLDELGSNEYDKLLPALAELKNESRVTIRFLLSSRSEPRLRRKLENAPSIELTPELIHGFLSGGN